MDIPREDGKTYREKLEYLAENGVKVPELDQAGIPESAMAAWHLWADLHTGRSSNGWGPTPLSWQDIRAWSEIRNTIPSYTEMDLIRAIDRAFLKASAKE